MLHDIRDLDFPCSPLHVAVTHGTDFYLYHVFLLAFAFTDPTVVPLLFVITWVSLIFGVFIRIRPTTPGGLLFNCFESVLNISTGRRCERTYSKGAR